MMRKIAFSRIRYACHVRMCHSLTKSITVYLQRKALFCLPLLLPAALTFPAAAQDGYTLEQVVVFSRHGLRAPLASPSSALGKVTPDA